MNKVTLFVVLALMLGGLSCAEHESEEVAPVRDISAGHKYQEIASVHDIMEVVQGPSMKVLSEMMKAGGPQSDDDWKHAREHVSILGESSQLLLMGARVKDEPWTGSATKVIAGSIEATAAAKAKDVAAFRSGMGSVGSGCRSCHKVYKEDKKKKKKSG